MFIVEQVFQGKYSIQESEFFFLFLNMPMKRKFRVLQSKIVGVLYNAYEWDVIAVGKPKEDGSNPSVGQLVLHVFRNSLTQS